MPAPTVEQAAMDLTKDYNEITRKLIVEYPEEFQHRLHGMHLFLTISNRYGLKSSDAEGAHLKADCRRHLPDIEEEHLGDACVSLIADTSFEKVREAANPLKMERIIAQNEILRRLSLGSFASEFQRPIHVRRIQEVMTSILANRSVDLTIHIDQSLDFSNPSTQNPRDVMPHGNELAPETVLEAIRIVLWMSGGCLRQGPGVIWIGPTCDGYESPEDWMR